MAAVIFGPTYIQFYDPGPARNRAITATAFSCAAALLYAIEVAWVCRRPGRMSCFWPTFPGVLRRLENYAANIIFAFICNTDLYVHQPALVWCVAAYSICLFLGAVALLLYLGGYSNKLPICFPIFLLGLALLSIFLYTSALILWLLYQFDENFGGQPQWSSDVSCRHQLTPFSVHLGPKTGCSHLDSGQPADLRG